MERLEEALAIKHVTGSVAPIIHSLGTQCKHVLSSRSFIYVCVCVCVVSDPLENPA